MRGGFNEQVITRCDQMVALVSPRYFERLFCVYELATFIHRYHGGPLHRYLDKDLVLLSQRWRNVFEGDRLNEEELKPLRTFRCRDAKTLKPADRALLLAAIRKEWGSEEAFDAFVRAALPPILASNKRRFRRAMARLSGERLGVAFGA